MRNKHHRTNHKLGKRAFALCLALAVICSCLLPVFATETGGIAVMPMDGGFAVDTGFGVGGEDAGVAVQPMDGGFAVDTGVDADVDTGFAVEPMDGGFAVDTGEDAGVDTGMTPGTGIVVTPPVADDSSSSASTSGPTIITKETEYGTVTEYDWGDSQTTWKDDEITITPNDNLKEDDAAFGVLPIEYHFWLQQLDSFTFETLSYEAEMAEMSVTEYLALFGSSKQFPIWHMDTIADTDTISNYKFANPTAKDDPEGQNREFAYWYTVDENGVETEFDPYKSYGSETETTVNVFAKWKNASGDVVNETTKTDDTAKTGTGTVEVSASAVIPSTNDHVTVTVKGLPETATHLSVESMGDSSMEEFYELYTAQNGTMAPLLGFKIAPKDASGNTVQPKGPVTVTISGLPEEIMLSELAPFKVLHQVSSVDIETINASYNNGTLTFATDSFSPFVIASKNGYSASTLNITANKTLIVGESITLTSDIGTNNKWYHSWTVESDPNGAIVVKQSDNGYSATVYAKANGTATIRHTYYGYMTDEYKITVTGGPTGSGAWVYLYAKVGGDTTGLFLNGHGWYTVGKVWVPNLADTSSANVTISTHYDGSTGTTKNYDANSSGTANSEEKNSNKRETGNAYYTLVMNQVKNGSVTRYSANNSIDFSSIKWEGAATVAKNDGTAVTTFQYFGLLIGAGADYYIPDGGMANAWHLDGYIDGSTMGSYIINYLEEGTNKVLQDSVKSDGTSGAVVKASDYGWNGQIITGYDGEQYTYVKADPKEVTLEHGKTKVINLYYARKTSSLTVSKTVTGLLGDTSKDFQFNLFVKTDANTNGATYLRSDGTNGNLSGLSNSDKESVGTEHYYKYPFTLKHGESITFNNLPTGSYYVEETDYSADGYETSYQIGNGDVVAQNRAAIELGDDAQTVAFTNHRKLDPDTGVLLDTLPYLVILAVVAGGGILLMLRKRRKNDD